MSGRIQDIEQRGGSAAVGCFIAIVIAALLLVVFTFFGSFTNVGVGEIGIVKHFGAVDQQHPDVFEPGFHLKVPFRDDVVIFDTRVQRADVDKVGAASRDGISITTHLVVNYHIDAKNAPLILQNVGSGYVNTVLSPAIQQAYKDTSGTYVALDMIQRRQELADTATKNLAAKMAPYYVIVDSVSIVNLEFPVAFDEAIQATQVANQNRAKAQQDQERSKIEAETALIVAQGLANAQKAQATTLTPEYLQLQAIQKWDGKLPLVNSPASILPFLGTAPTTAATAK